MENIFQRPPILMRLTMLTRDKMSLLRAASLQTAWETAHGLNDRKERGRVEAGILRLSAAPFFRQGAGNGADHCSGQTRIATIDGTDLEKGGKKATPQDGSRS